MKCIKCGLPECRPDIWLNEDNTCNICVDFDKRKALEKGVGVQSTDIVKILNKYKGKGKYDCLVMCSGGKDSTLSLYYIKKKYGMTPLAFTFDHGFEMEEALRNIRNAVDILGIDWMYFRTDYMRDVFTKLVNSGTKAPVCHVCAIWYMALTLDIAKRFNIPLIVGGWTKGQSLEKGEAGAEYAAMSECTEEFIKQHLNKDPKYKDFPRSMKEYMRRFRKKFKVELVSPHWFLDEDRGEGMEILKHELKWKAPATSYPAGTTNCIMNFVNVYLSMKNFGFTHYHVELSKLVRMGEISMEEANKMLEINFDKQFVNSILRKIGCKID